MSPRHETCHDGMHLARGLAPSRNEDQSAPREGLRGKLRGSFLLTGTPASRLHKVMSKAPCHRQDKLAISPSMIKVETVLGQPRPGPKTDPSGTKRRLLGDMP